MDDFRANFRYNGWAFERVGGGNVRFNANLLYRWHSNYLWLSDDDDWVHYYYGRDNFQDGAPTRALGVMNGYGGFKVSRNTKGDMSGIEWGYFIDLAVFRAAFRAEPGQVVYLERASETPGAEAFDALGSDITADKLQPVVESLMNNKSWMEKQARKHACRQPNAKSAASAQAVKLARLVQKSNKSVGARDRKKGAAARSHSVSSQADPT